jgi:hypothetical protein
VRVRLAPAQSAHARASWGLILLIPLPDQVGLTKLAPAGLGSVGDGHFAHDSRADYLRGTVRLVYDPPHFVSLAGASQCPYARARAYWF